MGLLGKLFGAKPAAAPVSSQPARAPAPPPPVAAPIALPKPAVSALLDETSTRALQTGLITVLLSAPAGDDVVKLDDGTELSVVRGVRPFPIEEVDRRWVGDRFDAGQGYLTFTGGLEGDGQDLWAMNGRARQLSRRVKQLLEAGGRGVVVHSAGQVVFDAAHFIERLGNLEDPHSRPFTAWVDVAPGEDDMLSSLGMNAFALPDVFIRAVLPMLSPEESYARAQEAVMVTCHQMVRFNRVLAENEEVQVPLGVTVGPGPLEDGNPGLVRSLDAKYAASYRGSELHLKFVAPPKRVQDLWVEKTLPYPAYREVILSSVRNKGLKQVARHPFEGHEVFVFERNDGRFLSLTCGLGQRAPHVELTLNLPVHDAVLAKQLSEMGKALPEQNVGAEKRLTFASPVGPLNVKTVVFPGGGGSVELGDGPEVSLLFPIPMRDDEVAEYGDDQVTQWLGDTGANTSDERWAELRGALRNSQ